MRKLSVMRPKKPYMHSLFNRSLKKSAAKVWEKALAEYMF